MISPVNIYRHTTYNVSLIQPFRENEQAKRIRYLLELECELEEKVNFIFSYIEQNKVSFQGLRKVTKELKKRRIIKQSIPNIGLQNLCLTYNKLHKEIHDVNEKLELESNNLFLCERKYLQSVYDRTALARSLEFTINGQVQEKLSKYTKLNVTKHNKNLRKLDRLLIQYLTRATLKTSPLADLTRTTFSKDKDNYQRTKQIITINNTFLIRLLEKIINRNLFKCNFRYKKNKTLVLEGNRIYVTVASENTINKNYLVKNTQGLRSIKYQKDIWTFLNQVNSWQSLSTLLGYSTEIFGESGKKILVRLINDNFLVQQNTIDTSNVKLLDNIIDFLKNNDLEKDLQKQLMEIAGLIQQASNEEKLNSELNCKIIRALRQIENTYSIEKIPEKKLLYIDFVGGNSENIKHCSKYSSLMAKFQILSLLFDSAFRSRIEVSDLFSERFGTKVAPKTEYERAYIFRFLGEKLAASKQTDIYSGLYNWRKHENNRLDKFNEYVVELLDDIEKHHNNSTYYINNAFMSKVEQTLKGYVSNEVISHSIFCQKVLDNNMVINHLYRGFTTFISRFSKDFPVSAKYQDYVSRKFKEVYEFPYTYGFNANIHKHYLNKKIRLPYDGSIKEKVSWDKLTISINKDNKLLEFRCCNQKVLPVFTGSLIKMLCPPIQNILDLTSSHGAMYFDLGDIYIHQKFQDSDELQFKHVPRIYIKEENRILNLSREKWVLKSKLIPNEKDNYVIQKKLISLFTNKGIPLQSFVRGINRDITKVKGNNTKPQYINLSSPLLCKLFMHILESNDYVVIEEELPKVTKKDEVCKEFILENTL